MSNQVAKQQSITVTSLISQEEVIKKFNDVLGKKANGFIASVITASKNDLKGVEPNSVLKAAMTAATLDLPIDKNLGFAYIIPYGNDASFQLSYKGYIQLAIRSGQYKTINAIEIYENEIKKINRLTGEIEFNENEEDINREKVVGYMAHFKLLNGFEKTIYMSKNEAEAHAKRYSQSYKSKYPSVVKKSLWTTDFDAMAIKTLLKRLISKYGIMSIDMQTAIIKDNNAEDVEKTVSNEIEGNANQTTLDFEDAVETEFTEVEEVIEDAPTEEPAF